MTCTLKLTVLLVIWMFYQQPAVNMVLFAYS